MVTKGNVKSRPQHNHHHQHDHHHHHNDKGCLKNWEDNLKRTKIKLKKVCANKESFSDKLANSTTWETKLKLYWDCIQITEDLAEKIADDLDLFKEHTKKVCDNTGCSVKSIKILYCYVIELYKCIDHLKEFLAKLLKEIECIDIEINEKSSKIYACLKAISDKLDESVSKQKDVIKSVIMVLQSAYLLHEAICSGSCGILYNLHVLCGLFPQSSEEEYNAKCIDIDHSCNATIEPVPVLPLNKDMFYVETRSQFNWARREKFWLRKKYEKWRVQCEALTSCKSSLEVAISTSKEVKECKK